MVGIPPGNSVFANLSASQNFVDIYTNVPITFTASAIGATEFNWNFGDGTVLNNGPANVSHTYTQAGNYTVSFDATNDICSDTATTSIEVTNTSGLTEITNSSIKIVSQGDLVTIKFTQLEGSGTIEIFNLIGERVFLQEQVSLKGTKQLFLSELAVGQYIIKIASKNQVYNQKINLTR